MSEEMVTVWSPNNRGEWEATEEPAKNHEIHYPLSDNERWSHAVNERLAELEKAVVLLSDKEAGENDDFCS